MAKRGGQSGNVNALKHGFYSRRFRDIEVSDLDTALRGGLEDEIALMRVMIRRVFDCAESVEAEDIESWSKALTSLGVAATRLAGLLRTQKIIEGDSSEVAGALSSALSEVIKEIGAR